MLVILTSLTTFMGWGGGGVLTLCPRRTFKYVTHFSNPVHGVGWGINVLSAKNFPSTLLTCNYVVGSSTSLATTLLSAISQIATTLLALRTSLATTLLSSSSNCNFVVGSSNITCNYVVICYHFHSTKS